ncbi:MAG: toprim domain-containing protein [Hyphomicrobiales bacterium]|nr:toprim domain-containing protein [Hyphomicrobiales bacterium]
MDERLKVRQVAQGRWPSILVALGMDERSLSGRHCPCPLCGGKDRFRFDDKEGRGTYFCSGCGAGDGMKLAMGITGLGFHGAACEIERIAGATLPARFKPERSDADKLAALRLVCRDAKAIEQGDQACRYLAGRGLRLHDLPESIRLHPGLSYRDGDEIGTYPAMLAIVTGADGTGRSVHRTYLQDGRKAPVRVPRKLMQGLPIAGAAIRLTPVSECLGIAEGIETALAAAELFEVPVWSCISTSGIDSFEPPEGVRELIIFADHDANFAGQSAAYGAAKRLSLKGYEVEVVVPPTQGDWLDELVRKTVEAEQSRVCQESVTALMGR